MKHLEISLDRSKQKSIQYRRVSSHWKDLLGFLQMDNASQRKAKINPPLYIRWKWVGPWVDGGGQLPAAAATITLLQGEKKMVQSDLITRCYCCKCLCWSGWQATQATTPFPPTPSMFLLELSPTLKQRSYKKRPVLLHSEQTSCSRFCLQKAAFWLNLCWS